MVLAHQLIIAHVLQTTLTLGAKHHIVTILQVMLEMYVMDMALVVHQIHVIVRLVTLETIVPMRIVSTS